MDKTKAWVIDIETYPNCFLFAVVRGDSKYSQVFEISNRKNEINRVFSCMQYIADNNNFMVSFNGLGFDYPILHELYIKRDKLPASGSAIARKVFALAQKQIESFRDENSFGNTVRTEDQLFKQLDLYRIWHFNNKAKATSLKLLEFNMKMNNIEDLPFAVGQELSSSEIDHLISYNIHDITATLNFFIASQSQIDFRISMSEMYGKDWLNCDDTKIGSEYFAMKLEESGVKMKEYRDGKQVIRQTKRNNIPIKDCLFGYYDFHRPEFIAVFNWFASQVITETKGVFSDIEEHELGQVAQYAILTTKQEKLRSKPTDQERDEFFRKHPLGWIDVRELKAMEYALDENGEFIMEYPPDEEGAPDFSKKMRKKKVPKKAYWSCWRVAETLNVVVDGFRFDFGTGGIHGSIDSRIIHENSKYQLVDADVSSMYPNLAISNNCSPEHLGESFCVIYKDMYEQRKSYPKGSPENSMLKLALNGTYGKSNDKYSIFYDPKFTMQITINGQLSLCLLAEKLMQIPGLKIAQVNTDGVTVALPRNAREDYDNICKQWQEQVKLELEFAEYKQMCIRDVNNYIALYTNGKIKRKGAYQYQDLGWHQNQGGLVIPMAAEAQMLQGIPIRDFIIDHLKNHDNIWNFMLRTKVPRSSKLVLETEEGDILQQNICRYYISTSGGKLFKIMPPLEGETELRRIGIDKEWNIKTCNKMPDFLEDLDVEYYAQEAEKLVVK